MYVYVRSSVEKRLCLTLELKITNQIKSNPVTFSYIVENTQSFLKFSEIMLHGNLYNYSYMIILRSYIPMF